MINLWCLYVALVVADDFAADLICLTINRFFSIQMQKRLSEVPKQTKNLCIFMLQEQKS